MRGRAQQRLAKPDFLPPTETFREEPEKEKPTCVLQPSLPQARLKAIFADPIVYLLFRNINTLKELIFNGIRFHGDLKMPILEQFL